MQMTRHIYWLPTFSLLFLSHFGAFARCKQELKQVTQYQANVELLQNPHLPENDFFKIYKQNVIIRLNLEAKFKKTRSVCLQDFASNIPQLLKDEDITLLNFRTSRRVVVKRSEKAFAFEEGDLILSNSFKFSSQTVASFTTGINYFTHLKVVLQDPATGELKLLESVPKLGLRFLPLSDANNPNGLRRTLYRFRNKALISSFVRELRFALQELNKTGAEIQYDYFYDHDDQTRLTCVELFWLAAKKMNLLGKMKPLMQEEVLIPSYYKKKYSELDRKKVFTPTLIVFHPDLIPVYEIVNLDPDIVRNTVASRLAFNSIFNFFERGYAFDTSPLQSPSFTLFTLRLCVGSYLSQSLFNRFCEYLFENTDFPLDAPEYIIELSLLYSPFVKVQDLIYHKLSRGKSYQSVAAELNKYLPNLIITSAIPSLTRIFKKMPSDAGKN